MAVFAQVPIHSLELLLLLRLRELTTHNRQLDLTLAMVMLIHVCVFETCCWCWYPEWTPGLYCLCPSAQPFPRIALALALARFDNWSWTAEAQCCAYRVYVKMHCSWCDACAGDVDPRMCDLNWFCWITQGEDQQFDDFDWFWWVLMDGKGPSNINGPNDSKMGLDLNIYMLLVFRV